MEVKADSWSVKISKEELEQFIREKTGHEFPEVYFNDIGVDGDDIIIDVRPQ